jgi:hypothetical protein
MDSDRLNRWLTLGANLGVLVGIILLIVELDQNREMMKSQTRNDLAMGIVGIQRGISENNQLADVIARAEAGETLTPSETVQFSTRSFAMYRYWENVHYQYRVGLYDEVEYSKQKDSWYGYMNANKANVQIWCNSRDIFSPAFAAEVDSLLKKYQC